MFLQQVCHQHLDVFTINSFGSHVQHKSSQEDKQSCLNEPESLSNVTTSQTDELFLISFCKRSLHPPVPQQHSPMSPKRSFQSPPTPTSTFFWNHRVCTARWCVASRQPLVQTHRSSPASVRAFQIRFDILLLICRSVTASG